MKVVVEKKFRDIHTGEIHHKGKLMNISEERYAEICSKDKSIVKEVNEERQDDAQEGKLKKLKVDDLRKLAEEFGLSTEGKKEELIARIMEEKRKEEQNEESEN